MPSPFPGMDPYIESQVDWAGFHLSYLAAVKAQLNARLPERYIADAETQTWIHEPDAESRRHLGIRPDVFVVERLGGGTAATATAAMPADMKAPAVATLPAVVREKRRFLKITDRAERRIVTIIELLSPSNKVGDDRAIYLARRADVLAGGVNLVEIDLLRGGPRLPLGDPPTDVGGYYVLVGRVSELPRVGIWPFSVRDPMPTIPVPLDTGVADCPLDLRACLDRVYDESRYPLALDRSLPVSPPLSQADTAWAAEVVRGPAGAG